MTEHKTILTPSEGEIEEKKSRFIGQLVHVESEDDALAFIEKVRKQHYDARHNCFAYIIGEKKELVRASDDGEPQKTAGQPILSVLQGADLTNVCLVVTRYFGGTLLGTGGLVKAYTDASKAALDANTVVNRRIGSTVSITASYNDWGKVQYLLSRDDIPTGDIRYEESVTATACLPKDLLPGFQKAVTEATAARAVIEILGEDYI